MQKPLELLTEFLGQAKSENLRTSHYPKEFKSFKMKVSFGQGVPARVPWISFFTPEMSTSNGFYPVFLYYKAEEKLVLAFGVSETHEFGRQWDASVVGEYPYVSEVMSDPPRYGESRAYRVFDIVHRAEGVELLAEGGQVSSQEISEDLDRILDLFAQNLDRELADDNSSISAGLFYMEKQLEDFIIANWERTEFGSNLDLIYEDGVLVSQQFRTDIGPIDILAKDRTSGDYVVIELKRNQTSDDTIGQVMRYMGWISEKFDNQSVRALIVSGKFDQKLEYAQKMMPRIDVHIYEVDFKLREHRNS